ncbi:UDP-N-acetylmuramoyl-L-alanyl-D-glutamate--2,6-diaminopimelate ligase [Aquisalimonas lutea]|uniref:UDP-N-acetylmuramoyl-L-alanyl-D-glutamate--2, 6-diaminopimelate ligase n=1 Tax=Aquisalimonas lutea TaxID=1327750 RepID=UPI0025B31489|nr:UDP-N-acetylmuramoyl-L-alanyl-D-glutamate--2,6-diaminopimelate ligase [Aquisalimonas lutea]MDN3517409.1 UDP-N-acetylmuramoyl-L-alanyl-D-glutamate--2,6-diaminopimelate ligase [Aquisalimonas lutea]
MSAALQKARGRPLHAVLQGLPVEPPAADPEIRDVVVDSRRAGPGRAFAAVAGSRCHGLDHLPAALAAGASAVLYEPGPAAGVADAEHACRDAGVPLVAVPDLGACLGELAARVHGEPARELQCLGVTGTDGKTSVTQFLAAALDEPGRRCAVLGTLGAGFPGAVSDTGMTTPDAATVQRLLRRFVGEGAARVAMEVSSHALVQHRVAAVPFDTAVLTNLGRDHLDYHGGPEAYAEAKARLFRTSGLRLAVLNRDDPLGARLRRELRDAGVQVIDYSLDSDADAEVICTSLHTGAEGLRLSAITPAGVVDVDAPLLGRFNAANLLAVIAVLVGQGLHGEALHAALQRIRPVPGRMEPFPAPGRALAVVDYAHTPGALEAALMALREHTKGRLWCVFGCGGERDPGKRPLMAAAAEARADCLVLTDDNPRGEDPDAILSAMGNGLRRPGRARMIRDRASAIAAALAEAEPGDTVLVAGKGHETEQVTAAGSRHFSDRETVAGIQSGGAT